MNYCIKLSIIATCALIASPSCGSTTGASTDRNQPDEHGSDRPDAGKNPETQPESVPPQGSTSQDAGKTDSPNSAEGYLPCMGTECPSPSERPQPLPRPDCPDVEPTPDSSCEDDGLECTYGESPSSFCRAWYRCSEAKWFLVAEPLLICADGIPVCPETTAQLGECLTSETMTYLGCAYSESVRCTCISILGPGSAYGTWYCVGAPNDTRCPATLPNLGTGCEGGALQCNYSVGCAGAAIESVFCFDGTWQLGTGTGCFG